VCHGDCPVSGDTVVVLESPLPVCRAHRVHRVRTDIGWPTVDLQDHAGRVAERHRTVVAVTVGVQRLRIAGVEYRVCGHEPPGQRVVVTGTDVRHARGVLVAAEEAVFVRPRRRRRPTVATVGVLPALAHGQVRRVDRGVGGSVVIGQLPAQPARTGARRDGLAVVAVEPGTGCEEATGGNPQFRVADRQGRSGRVLGDEEVSVGVVEVFAFGAVGFFRGGDVAFGVVGERLRGSGGAAGLGAARVGVAVVGLRPAVRAVGGDGLDRVRALLPGGGIGRVRRHVTGGGVLDLGLAVAGVVEGPGRPVRCRATDTGLGGLGRAVTGRRGPCFGETLQVVLPEALGVRRVSGWGVGDLGGVADRVVGVDAVGDPEVRRRRSLGLDRGEPVGAVFVGVGDRDLVRTGGVVEFGAQGLAEGVVAGVRDQLGLGAGIEGFGGATGVIVDREGFAGQAAGFGAAGGADGARARVVGDAEVVRSGEAPVPGRDGDLAAGGSARGVVAGGFLGVGLGVDVAGRAGRLTGQQGVVGPAGEFGAGGGGAVVLGGLAAEVVVGVADEPVAGVGGSQQAVADVVGERRLPGVGVRRRGFRPRRS
jgi:hypothetical protein